MGWGFRGEGFDWVSEGVVGAQPSVVVRQGGLDPVVEFLGVPDGAVLFQELEDLFQNHLGVGGGAGVLDFEIVADDFGCSVLEIQDSSVVWSRIR